MEGTVRKVLLAAALFGLGQKCHANPFERLSKQGYAVVEQTTVNGEFNGCEWNRRIPLSNGMVFVCETYLYHYGYMPTVYILSSIRGLPPKVIIDGQHFDGSLWRAR
jgi:hypothetical protein